MNSEKSINKKNTIAIETFVVKFAFCVRYIKLLVKKFLENLLNFKSRHFIYHSSSVILKYEHKLEKKLVVIFFISLLKNN